MPRTDNAERLPYREDFVKLLEWQLEKSGLTHRELAEKAKWPSHSVIYRWLRYEGEPKPQEVFDMEHAFDIPAGSLSRTLGYLPLNARSTIDPDASFEDFIANDPDLDELGRRILRSIYAEVSRKGRSPKRGTAVRTGSR